MGCTLLRSLVGLVVGYGLLVVRMVGLVYMRWGMRLLLELIFKVVLLALDYMWIPVRRLGMD
jgi:hypothetical protein